MNNDYPPTRRRKVVIGYLASVCVFLILNTLYWGLVEHRFDLALLTPIAPILFGVGYAIASLALSQPMLVEQFVAGAAVVGLLVGTAVSMTISLRRTGSRRWAQITHGCLLIYYLLCFASGKVIIGIEQAIAC